MAYIFDGKCETGRKGKECEWCYISTEECIHSRRCFMTGEYCSKQTNIQREREKQYKQDEITVTAFVIMNFSDMSDVVYKWRLKPFIESLAKYLHYDKQQKKLYCCMGEQVVEGLEKVKNIRVVRADSDQSSNYVVCSRICQQMQIADLVVVDVSSQNANVFYEFGMAVALGKLILPICYGESFYKMNKNLIDKDREEQSTKQHIGCYTWRKKLFEYYGIKYKRSDKGSTKYEELSYVTKRAGYAYDDLKYTRFPYDEKKDKNSSEPPIGEQIYNRLKEAYNRSGPNDNTLVVYTLEGFLNEKQAGRCIVNYYCGFTARMAAEQCFSGERVGVLVQESGIPESEKDTEELLNLYYNKGEIIHIGVNQATYLAAEERLKTEDGLKDLAAEVGEEESALPRKDQKEEIKRIVKEHIQNRGMLIYPNNPVFVNRVKRNQIQEKILNNFEQPEGGYGCCKEDTFCLFHVMLRNLKYTNEIVVDITDNCLQSLFWLGAAHGSDIYAITVLHEKTEKERLAISEETGSASGGIGKKIVKKYRNVFDVAGLWTAIFEKGDTEGFYNQLALAQMGIERHSKLSAVKRGYYEKTIREYLFAFDSEREKDKLDKLEVKKKAEEEQLLESYYRTKFWSPMLRYNRLRLYLVKHNDIDIGDGEPRIHTAKWDFDAIAALSHYLSKRTVIGEYLIKSLSPDEKDDEAKKTNFICIGSTVKPLGEDLPKYIHEKLQEEKKTQSLFDLDHRNMIHKHDVRKDTSESEECRECQNCYYIKKNLENRICKGFKSLGEEKHSLYTQHPQAQCARCRKSEIGDAEDTTKGNAPKALCQKTTRTNCTEKGCLVLRSTHIEIAQLILWREEPDKQHERGYFRVGICGSSGPATYALTTLFVGEDQKEDIFNPEQSSDRKKLHLLSQLQEVVRKKLMELFLKRLQMKLNGIKLVSATSGILIEGNQKTRYFYLVKHAVSYYLSTILFQYFIPFLSEKDITCICNGMTMYVYSMKEANASPFSLEYPEKGDPDYESVIAGESIMAVIKAVPKVLEDVLRGFRGCEVFYDVEVKQVWEDREKQVNDTRLVQGIRMREEDNINCFFLS